MTLTLPLCGMAHPGDFFDVQITDLFQPVPDKLMTAKHPYTTLYCCVTAVVHTQSSFEHSLALFSKRHNFCDETPRTISSSFIFWKLPQIFIFPWSWILMNKYVDQHWSFFWSTTVAFLLPFNFLRPSKSKCITYSFVSGINITSVLFPLPIWQKKMDP